MIEKHLPSVNGAVSDSEDSWDILVPDNMSTENLNSYAGSAPTGSTAYTADHVKKWVKNAASQGWAAVVTTSSGETYTKDTLTLTKTDIDNAINNSATYGIKTAQEGHVWEAINATDSTLKMKTARQIANADKGKYVVGWDFQINSTNTYSNT